MKTRKKVALKAFKKAKNQREIVLLEDDVKQKFKIRAKLIEDK